MMNDMELLRKLGTRLINGKGVSFGIFKCPDCLQEVERRLTNGLRDKSCGCIRYKLMAESNTKHWEIKIRLYGVWSSMKQRILDYNHKSYKNYGGRGISICPEWAN